MATRLVDSCHYSLSASIPLASGNRTVVFFGESLLPYIQSVSFPGGDFVVIPKDGHVTIEFAHHTGKGRKVTGEGNGEKEEKKRKRRGSPMGPQPVRLYEMSSPFGEWRSSYPFKCGCAPEVETLPPFRV